MPKEIISKTITVDRPESITIPYIENLLFAKLGEPLRWSIIDCSADTLKICVTYEQVTV